MKEERREAGHSVGSIDSGEIGLIGFTKALVSTVRIELLEFEGSAEQRHHGFNFEVSGVASENLQFEIGEQL